MPGGGVPEWLLELVINPDPGAEEIFTPPAADGPADANVEAGKHASSI